jgi:hypothetical protein
MNLPKIDPTILKILLFAGGGLLIASEIKKGITTATDKLTGDSEAERKRKAENDKLITDIKFAPFWSDNYIKTLPPNTSLLTYTDRIGKTRTIRTALIDEKLSFQLSDAETRVFTVFRSLKNKAMVSQINTEFKSLYKQDLYYAMQDSLTTNSFGEVLRIINQLPNY